MTKSLISKISAFDLDRTLLSCNSSYSFCKYLYRKKVFSLQEMAYSLFCRFRFERGALTLQQLHEKIFGRLLLGTMLSAVEAHVAAFLEDFLSKHLYSPAFLALQEAQNSGHYTVILSNSPDFLVGPIATYFKVDEWKGTEYRVDKDGVLCNIANLMEGIAKARCLEEIRERLKISRENVTVYTDSHHDLPLLQEAGSRVAVNPDSTLRKIARDNHWSVI